MDELENEIVELGYKLDDLEDKLKSPIKINETKEEFLNLLKMLCYKIEYGTLAEQDNLARILLLNIQINHKNKPIFLWKEPFSSLLKMKNVQFGARDWT